MSDLNYAADPNFQSMIDNLIDGSWGNTSDNFSGNTLLDDNGTNYSRRTNQLWNQLLLHMHNKFATFDNNKYHYGIRESDFPVDKESIVEFINSNIDLDKDGISLLDKYFSSQLEDNSHWNESIAKLAEYYYNLFKNSDNEDEIDKTNITIKDLKNANAGASFLKDSEWVIPWENIDKNSYSDIRKNDKIQSVLSNKDNLQFTQNEQLNQYLRLIMPEYKRIVEVEDMNRNFWVIGQALTALCGFLFEDDSPLPQLMAVLLDEIAQLWENMFFLWLTLSLLSYKNFYEDIETVFLPISNNEIMVNVKFDNFDDTGLEEEKTFEDMDKEDLRELLRKIWEEKMEFLKDKYNNCALVVFPEIRVNNYMKNYYLKAVYIGCIIYDDSLKNEEDWLKFIPFDGALIVDLKEQKIIVPVSSEHPAPDYDEWKIAVILLDERGDPTDQIEYFDTIRSAQSYMYSADSSNRYLLYIGENAGITELALNALASTTTLRKARIPDSVVSIGVSAFLDCSNLATIDGMNEISSIGNNAFSGCASLKNINLPDALITIGHNAFRYSGLESIIIPDSVTSELYQICLGCTDLESATIGASVSKIYTNAFKDCTSLTDVLIKDGIPEISNNSFYNCLSLTSISIPHSVSVMDTSPFAECTNLFEIIVDAKWGDVTPSYWYPPTTPYCWGAPNATITWARGYPAIKIMNGSSVVKYTDNIGEASNFVHNGSSGDRYYVEISGDTVTSVAGFANSQYLYGISMNADSITTIADGACYGCYNLATVEIGSAVSSIGSASFANCTSLSTIKINQSENSISGAPWGATNAQIIWTG